MEKTTQNIFSRVTLSIQLIGISVLLVLILAVYQYGAWQSEQATLRNANTILTNLLADLEADQRSLDEVVQQISSRLTSIREFALMLFETSTNQSHADQLSVLEANSYRHLNLFIPKPPRFDSVEDLATINDPSLIRFISIYYDLPGLPSENTIGYNFLVVEWNQLRPNQQESTVIGQALLPQFEVDELKVDREYLNLITQTEEYLDNYEFRHLQFKNRNEHLQEMIRAKIRL